jgi:hypothetical protein
VVALTDEGHGPAEEVDEWEADSLLDLVSHDLINQQQAALGFLELLEDSDGLTEGERDLVSRTMEVLEHTARLLLQVRTAMVQRERGGFRPVRVALDKALVTAAATAQGAFGKERLDITTLGTEGGHGVMADALLPEMLTQLMILLCGQAPMDRSCRMTVTMEPTGATTAIRFTSEGFALNPMVTESITGGRRPMGRNRDVAAIGLVRHLLRQYGATASMEDAPPGEVGADLVIQLPSGGGTDAIDNDSR